MLSVVIRFYVGWRRVKIRVSLVLQSEAVGLCVWGVCVRTVTVMTHDQAAAHDGCLEFGYRARIQEPQVFEMLPQTPQHFREAIQT